MTVLSTSKLARKDSPSTRSGRTEKGGGFWRLSPFDACRPRALACKRRSHEHFGQDFPLVGRRDRRHAAEQLEHGREGRRGRTRPPLFPRAKRRPPLGST